MQKRSAFATDVDKGGLHAGQHAHHLAHVNIADKAARRGPFDVQFLGHAVFDDGDPGFLRCDVDQYIFAHGESQGMLMP